MQFQVPQFIEEEDKIVGPFTLKQFGYLAGAGLVTLIVFSILGTSGKTIAVIISLIAFGIASAFVWWRPGERPLSIYVKNMLFFYWNPQMFVWKRQNQFSASHVPEIQQHSPQGVIASLRSSISKFAPGNKKGTPQEEEGGPITPHSKRIQGLSIRTPRQSFSLSNIIAHKTPLSTISKEEKAVPSALPPRPTFAPKESLPANISSGSRVQGLSEQLLTTKIPLPKREHVHGISLPTQPSIPPGRSKIGKFAFIERITGDHQIAKRVDYR